MNGEAPAAAKTIVVCDDNNDILEMYQMLLSAEGYAVRTAHGFVELKPLFTTLKPDLLILDIQMPEMDGFDVLDELKRLNLTVPVFMITAHDNFIYRRYAPVIGALEYLTKPVDCDKLLSKIKTILK